MHSVRRAFDSLYFVILTVCDSLSSDMYHLLHIGYCQLPSKQGGYPLCLLIQKCNV
jgi:hypothetical protein